MSIFDVVMEGSMKKRILSVILCCLLVFSCVPVALADNDTTPPDLVSVSVNKTSFNVGETVVFTVKATDAESGLANGGINGARLDISSQNQSTGVSLVLQSDGETLIGELTLEDSYQSGDYLLAQICLKDNSGNTIDYVAGNPWNDARLLPPEMAITIHVTNNERTDWEGPVLQSLTVDKTVANAGDTVNFEAVATDPSGLFHLASSLVGPKSLSIDLAPVDGHPNKLKGSVKIPDSYPNGTYICDGCIIGDKLGNTSIYSSQPSGYEKLTPAAARVSVQIQRGRQITSNVTVTDIQINPTKVRQGEPVSFRVTLNDGGNQIDGFEIAITPKIWADLHMQQTGTQMKKVSDGVYEGSILPPVNWPAGEYVINEMVWIEQNTGSYPNWNGKAYSSMHSGDYPSFNVSSVFSGTTNTSVLVGGSNFDPMDGISAINSTEGNMTGKIEVTGSVNTQKAGVYLLKYRIPSMYTDSWTNQTLYYYDFRWVGVTEIMPGRTGSGSQTPLALTNDSLAVGASKSEVSIKKDGKSIGYSNVVKAPGVYTLTGKGGASTASASGQATTMANSTSASAASKTVTAMIDRTGPALSAAWGKSGKSVKVSVKASDVAGVAQLKYKAGSCSLADCRKKGKTFSGTFSVPNYGTYTLYAKDKLGNESAKVIKVTASSANFAYLSGVDLSVGKLSRSFSKTVYKYKISLGESQSSVRLAPKKEWAGATMTINGKAVSSATISVANGKTAKATVKVTYGKSKKTYTFSITRAKSTNNKLSALKATAGKLDKPFSPGVTKYTLTLDKNTKSVTLRATAQTKLARVSPSSKKITLKNGQSKTVKFTVKAQSGAKKTYTVTIKRQ